MKDEPIPINLTAGDSLLVSKDFSVLYEAVPRVSVGDIIATIMSNF